MKKDHVLEQLIRFIKEHHFKKGDRLPPERQLGTILKTSRPTIRESIRKLEERGLLTIKRGSGIYLNRNSENIDSEPYLETIDKDIHLKDLLEALYIIAPSVVKYAVERAEEAEILKLHDCIVRMSRAIVTKNLSVLSEADMEFYQLLGLMSKNRSLSRIMVQLIAGNELYWAQLIDHDPFVNNTIFAGYVEIVSEMKRGCPESAAEKTRKHLVNISECLSKINNHSDYSLSYPQDNQGQNN